MSTSVTTTDVTEVINARRTESLDAPRIIELVTEQTENMFGIVNIIHLIEKALLAVTLTGENEEIVAHAAFYDYPNISTVDPAEWESWINCGYDVNKANPLNSLFIHHFVARPGYGPTAIKEILRTVFNAASQIHYVFFFCKENSYPDDYLTAVFPPLIVKKEGTATDNPAFLCNRHLFLPVLHIRQARVEDNDDLGPIFSKQSDVLQKTYGEFFVAELVESQSDQMQCLAAEVEGKAVGFMSVCDHINLDILNSCFELTAFHGLRKPSPDDILNPPPPSPKSESVSSEKPLIDQTEPLPETLGNESSTDFPSAPHFESSDALVKENGFDGDHDDDGNGTQKPAIHHKLSECSQNGGVIQEDTAAQPEPLSRKTTRVMPPAPPATAIKKFVPTFVGESNAVVIQLFAINERYEMRSLDFMPKVFELFPTKDFAVVTVPHLVPEFPLLQNFVRVTPKTNSTLSHELYVFNKGGLISNFKVRKAQRSDLSGIQKLVTDLKLNPELIVVLETYFQSRRDDDGTEIQAFVAECMKQVVGVAVIRREEKIEYVRSHYNIEDFIYYDHHRREEHGHVHHLAVNPIFSHLSKQFVKEILRLGHKTCLYYPVYPAHAPQEMHANHSLITTLGDFVPVRARRQIVYPVDRLKGNAPSERVLQEEFPYALNHINRKLINEPKVAINARIVVVGASTTGLAFLEALVFCPHLRFNNLTLVSPHGIPGDTFMDELCDHMLGTNHCYSMKEYIQISLRTFVNVVYGKMTSIDRKKKFISIDNCYHVPYDHLVITTGLQYQLPSPTEADISTLPTTKEVPNSPDRPFTGKCPTNLHVINDHLDAVDALYQAEVRYLDIPGNILVYGDSLETYCAIQTFMELGFPGNRIILVKPPCREEKHDPRSNMNSMVFNNPEVEAIIMSAMTSAGVHVNNGFLLAQWTWNESGDQITSASFTSNAKPKRLDCIAFFSYYKKIVDYDSFKAINNACLVFDCRLVIDSNFHTNDASIRGAGSLTKFQRIYHADQWSHSKFNSKVVGEELAQTMLRLFDPTMVPAKFPIKEELKLIPLFDGPKVMGALLPGEFYYLQVGKPSLDMPLNTQVVQSDYGSVFITGQNDLENKGYFRLHLNQYNSVETITCLSKNPYPYSNFIWLYGIHEKILNNLCGRWQEGLINNFYDYFNEDWTLAIYHDRFNDFRDEIRELLLTQPSENRMALEEKIRQMVDDDLTLTDAQRSSLVEEYRTSGAKRAVETRLLSFISYNYYHLPMYAKPGMV